MFDPITEPFFCGNEIGKTGFLQLFPQPRHVDRQRVVVNKAVAFPQPLHDFLAGNDLAAVFHEQLQNLIFIFGQVDFLPGIGQRRIVQIEHGTAQLQHAHLPLKRIGAAQKRTDLGGQHVQIKRFGDKIVAAHVHRHDDVHIVRSGG